MKKIRVVTGDETEAEEAQVTTDRVVALTAEEVLENSYRALMSLPDGRRVLWDLLANRLGLYRSPLSGDTNVTYINAGKHEEALRLRDYLKTTWPIEYRRMQQENDV